MHSLLATSGPVEQMASAVAVALAAKLDSVAVQIETLDPEPSLALEGLHVQTGLTSVDERQQALAEHAKLKLPLPMQTLLNALLDVKQDMERDLVRQELNADSAILEACASEVAFVASETDRCRGLFETNAPTKQLRTLPDVERIMERVQAKYGRLVTGAGGTTGTAGTAGSAAAAVAGMEGPLNALQRMLHHTQRAHLKAKQALFEARSVPLARAAPPTTASLQAASKAVAESSAMRHRLAALATGELKDLIEPVAGLEAPSAVIEETTLSALSALSATPTGPSSAPSMRPSETAEGLEGLLADIHDAIRTVRRALVGLQADQRAIVQSSVDALCATLRTSAARLRAAAADKHHAVVSTTLARADKALQSEIAQVLKTISVDRPALDSFLKSIKAKCVVMRQSSAAQAARDAELQYARWILQLDAVIKECIDAALAAK